MSYTFFSNIIYVNHKIFMVFKMISHFLEKKKYLFKIYLEILIEFTSAVKFTLKETNILKIHLL